MKYYLETVNPSHIYVDVELVIKFDCHDRWVFKTRDGEYVVLNTVGIGRLEPRNENSMKNELSNAIMKHGSVVDAIIEENED